MEQEIRKDIKDYEWLYQVSNFGNVKSLERKDSLCRYIMKEKMLQYKTQNRIYYEVALCKKSNSKHFSIHKLVAQTFILNPENKPQVNHINWIKTDNRVENLEWCTASENILHSYRILWNKISEKHHLKVNHPDKWKFWKDNRKSKKINQYDLNLDFIKSWDCMNDVTRTIWIHQGSISSNCLWKQKTAGWFI